MDFLKAALGHVGVDFSGIDVGMAEEFLDDSKIGASFQQMGGETVAEGMRGEISGNPG